MRRVIQLNMFVFNVLLTCFFLFNHVFVRTCLNSLKQCFHEILSFGKIKAPAVCDVTKLEQMVLGKLILGFWIHPKKDGRLSRHQTLNDTLKDGMKTS